MSLAADIPSDPEAALDPVAEKRAAVVRGLRLYFRRHNIQAFMLAIFSLATSVFLWGMIYVFTYWFSLVVATLSLAFNPATLTQITREDLAGRYFTLYFIAGALLSLVIAWWTRKYVRPNRLREARFYLLWILAELLLSVPNATFAVWGNFSAITRLRREDALAAARLLQRMDTTEGCIKLSRLRVEIEDEAVLQRVFYSLQLIGLLCVRERNHGWFLCFTRREALTLLCRSAGEAA